MSHHYFQYNDETKRIIRSSSSHLRVLVDRDYDMIGLVTAFDCPSTILNDYMIDMEVPFLNFKHFNLF